MTSPSLVDQHSVYILGQVDEKKLEDIRNASSDVITSSLKLITWHTMEESCLYAVLKN